MIAFSTAPAQVVPTGSMDEACAKVLQNPDVAYVHVRSSTNNCYHCRVERD